MHQGDTVLVVPTAGGVPVLNQSCVWTAREEEISGLSGMEFYQVYSKLFLDVFAAGSQHGCC